MQFLTRRDLIKGNMYKDERQSEQTIIYTGKDGNGLYKFRIDYKHVLSRYIVFDDTDLKYLQEVK